jgi:hypothetical protein
MSCPRVMITATATALAMMVLCVPPVPGEAIDMLDYMLQTDDTDHAWTLGGHDTSDAPDPDGGGSRVFVLNKFHSDSDFEVFKVTDTEIQIRYEVNKGKQIRRFEELGREGRAPGHVWLRRFMEPGGPGFTSTAAIDAYAWDGESSAYVWDPDQSVQQMKVRFSVDWATIDWGKMNQSGFEIDRVLRLHSEWQTLGLIYETYDYAKGKGIVNWRWLEWLDGYILKRPLKSDATGTLFETEQGLVEVADSEADPPEVYAWDAAAGKRGRRLEVVHWTSHWTPEDGPRRYVVLRDLSREYPLEKQAEFLSPDYGLPLWEGGDRTLADLPHHYTRPLAR